MNHDKYEQLLTDGYCLFENVLSSEMLARLRATTGGLLDTQSQQQRKTTRSQGSMLFTNSDPFFADLIAWPAALKALAELGYFYPTFSDGYIISKPGHSPRLFWHYDWFAWEDERSYEPEPLQLFAMYYLSDTTRRNGCLRVIPGSHRHHNPLHDELREPHSPTLSQARDLSLAEFSDRPDEVDVAVNAGDLLIGDARLLHAAHENTTDERRTLITLWYQPTFDALPPRIQAQMAAKTHPLPAEWPIETREQLRPLFASTRYVGSAQPYARSLYARNGLEARLPIAVTGG